MRMHQKLLTAKLKYFYMDVQICLKWSDNVGWTLKWHLAHKKSQCNITTGFPRESPIKVYVVTRPNPWRTYRTRTMATANKTCVSGKN